MAPVSMKFPTAKLRRGSPDVCPPLGAARKIEDYYVFPMGSGFCAVGQSRTPTAMVAANWRGCDVAFARAGCLHPGYRGGWEWRQGSDRVAWITLWQDNDRLILSYRVSRNGGKWRDVEQPTQIVWMPCHLGGQRPYFLCPGIVNGVVCNRRVTKLYGAGDYFLCRHCYRLAYASQRENGSDRAFRRANKVRARLGGDASMASSFPGASKRYAPQDF